LGVEIPDFLNANRKNILQCSNGVICTGYSVKLATIVNIVFGPVQMMTYGGVLDEIGEKLLFLGR
jgi:hypothetical protein